MIIHATINILSSFSLLSVHLGGESKKVEKSPSRVYTVIKCLKYISISNVIFVDICHILSHRCKFILIISDSLQLSNLLQLKFK